MPLHLSCRFLYIYVASPLHFSLSITNFQSKNHRLLLETSIPSFWCDRSPCTLRCLFTPFTVNTSCLKLNFIFLLFLNIACSSTMYNFRVLGFYPSRVGYRCLVRRRVINRVFATGWAMMRCIRQVRMTPAPPMMNEICHPTHLLRRGMRMWMWTG